MPTYEYDCRTCGHRFEVMQSMSAEPLSHCPVAECILDDERKGTGEVVRRVSGGAGLVFKGEGFYLTDYARKGKEGNVASTPGSSGGSSSKSTAKSEGGESKGGGDASGDKGKATKRDDPAKGKSSSDSKGTSSTSSTDNG